MMEPYLSAQCADRLINYFTSAVYLLTIHCHLIRFLLRLALLVTIRVNFGLFRIQNFIQFF